MNRYIVALTGTHGTGKSSILRGIKALGYPVCESQLSRTAQKSLGWDSLKRVYESTQNMWSLQEAMLAAMDARDKEIEASHLVTIAERAPSCMWAYTKEWCKRLGIDIETDERAVWYKQECRKLMDRYAALLIVPMSDAVPFVEEPNRADLASRKPVSDTINDFLVGYPYYTLENSNLDLRILEAKIAMECVALKGTL